MAITAAGVHSPDYLEAHLAKELEGGLFVSFFMTAEFGKSWSIQKHYYTVADGTVYEVGNGRHGATGDTMLEIHSSCRRVGNYDPNQNYEIQICDFTFDEICKLLDTATNLQRTEKETEAPNS